MKVTVCQLDNRSLYLDAMLAGLEQHLKQENSDFLLLPEMCFAEWLAADPIADGARWKSAVLEHEKRIRQLHQLGVAAVVATRPIIRRSGSHRNQAYLWTSAGGLQGIHEKYYLPDEADYWENSWYDRGQPTYELARVQDVRIGIQICTEMWFFEWARHYARAQADILCVPRATPHETLEKWLAGGQAAAVCSGAYCLSSNLWNPPGSKANLGGQGWVIDPDGVVLARTDEETPFRTVKIDLKYARRSKTTYPRYLRE